MREYVKKSELLTVYPGACEPAGTAPAASGRKRRVLVIYTNLGIGGIARSLIVFLRNLDYTAYDVTLYIRRDDVLDLIGEIPDETEIVTVRSGVKRLEFEDNLLGKAARRVYSLLRKKHAFAAKRFFETYKRPVQRRREKAELKTIRAEWDVAVSYSTDGDDPVFLKKCVCAKKKYVFVHQSTALAAQNVKAMRDTDGIVVVNPSLSPWIRETVGGKTPVSAIENYVDPDTVRRLAAEKTVSAEGKTVFATCGRICGTKGYDVMLGAARRLKEQGVRFVWYWVGDGPDREKMEELILRCGLRDEIVITGFLQNPFPYVNACALYVQPSRAEAYPLSVIEALILLKPVVAGRTAGTDYILGKYRCGSSVELSPEAIADEMLRMLTKPQILREEREKLRRIDWEAERAAYESRVRALLNE